ncbi:MAG: hypothetical protein HY924_04575 [Elusimicrobia bacterium]|nr:hypothetical protein [Elusimicrobiota bacterium]
MKKLLSALLASAFLSVPAFSATLEDLARTDLSFALTVRETVAAYQAGDAFRQAPECAFLDYKYFRRFTLAEAVAMLQPCAEGVSRRSALSLKAELGVVRTATESEGPLMGIVLRTGDASIASQGMRDLNYSLRQRNFELLGHPVLLRRASDEAAGRKSAAQDAVDSCMLTTVLRKIESGADFIKAYGKCITSSEVLKVKELRPAPNRELGVVALTAGGDMVVQSLNGGVTVASETGPVTVLIIAYPETFSLPK